VDESIRSDDEARTPLIISGPSEESTDKYYRIDNIIRNEFRISTTRWMKSLVPRR